MVQLLDMERKPFPFRTHWTQRQALAMEKLRLTISDAAIMDRYISEDFMGRPLDDIADYLLRNPRREERTA